MSLTIFGCPSPFCMRALPIDPLLTCPPSLALPHPPFVLPLSPRLLFDTVRCWRGAVIERQEKESNIQAGALFSWSCHVRAIGASMRRSAAFGFHKWLEGIAKKRTFDSVTSSVLRMWQDAASRNRSLRELRERRDANLLVLCFGSWESVRGARTVLLRSDSSELLNPNP